MCRLLRLFAFLRRTDPCEVHGPDGPTGQTNRARHQAVSESAKRSVVIRETIDD